MITDVMVLIFQLRAPDREEIFTWYKPGDKYEPDKMICLDCSEPPTLNLTVAVPFFPAFYFRPKDGGEMEIVSPFKSTYRTLSICRRL